MSDDNRVSASLSDEDLAAIHDAIASIRSKLPFLVSLTAQERRQIPKMGDKSVGFDTKCMAYMTTNPEFLPGFVLIDEVGKDRSLRTQIMQFFADLSTLTEKVTDTLTVVNSEIWMSDLAYYQNVRQAARRGIAGAKTIYEDLSPRFPGSGGGAGNGGSDGGGGAVSSARSGEVAVGS